MPSIPSRTIGNRASKPNIKVLLGGPFSVSGLASIVGKKYLLPPSLWNFVPIKKSVELKKSPQIKDFLTGMVFALQFGIYRNSMEADRD